MLQLIDRLAGWWLNWRLDREVATNPELKEFRFRKMEVEDGRFNIIGAAPFVVDLADEAARLLKGYNAQNYLEFDMLPRLDRGLKPVRVTVQWAEGESPATRAERLESELKNFVEEYTDLTYADYIAAVSINDCICGHSRFGHRWPHKECLQWECDCKAFTPKQDSTDV